MKKILIEIEEVLRLKKEGMTDAKIAEYLEEQGIKVNFQTIGRKLREYYKTIGEEKPRNRINLPMEEIVELKEAGMTEENIVNYLKEKGIEVSLKTINKRLTEYYERIGEEKPKKHGKLSIEEIVKLKEDGMTDNEIANLISEKEGITVKSNTVSQRLIRYYKLQGKEKPNKHIQKKFIPIEIEEIVKLKKEGMSDRKIVEYFEKQGIKVSHGTITRRLNKYYKATGESRPKVKSGVIKGTIRKEVPIEEIVRLKEAKMSTEKIREYLESQGIKICISTINRRLNEYYSTNGVKKPRKTKDLPMEEIVKLKEEGMTDKKIVSHLASQGIEVSESTISNRLTEYYHIMGIEKPKRDENVNAWLYRKLKIPKEKYDNSIKHILMNGMTIDEYITETSKEDERENIEIKLRKLEFLAGYSDIRERTMDYR